MSQIPSHGTLDDFIKENNLADESLIAFLKDAKYGTKDLANYQQYLKDTGKATSQFSGFVNKAKGVLKGFGAALGSMAVNWAIGEAIGLVVTAIDNEIHRVEYAQERLENFNNTVSESKNELENQKKWIEENGSRYEELAHGVDNYGHNVSLTADEFSEYNSITKEIASMFPDMVSGYNDQNDAIIKTKGSVDALTESYKNNVKAQYAKTLSKSDKTYDDYKTAIKDAEKQKSGIEFLIKSKNRKMFLGDNYGFTLSDGKYSKDFRDILGNDLYGEVENYIRDNESKFKSLDKNGNSSLIFSFDNLSTELQQKIRSAFTVANSTIKSETAKVRPVLEAFIYGEDGDSSGYGSLDEDGKQIIRNVISNLDDSFYSQFNSDSDMASYFQSYFIEPLKNGLDDSDLAVKINTLFSLDKNNYKSYQEYVNAVLAKINEIKGYKDANGNPIYSDEQIDSLKKTFGVSDVDSSGDVSGKALIGKVTDKYSGINGSKEYIESLNEKELRYLHDLKEEVKTVDELRNSITELNKEKANKNKTISFKEAWKSLNTEAKDSLLELAEAGKLTKEEFEKSSASQTILEQTKLSAEEATKEVNKLVSTADQLSSMKSGISSISSILGEKKENVSNKNTRNKGIGADTLAGMPEDVKAQSDEYEHFVEVLGNGSSTMEQCKEAANKLATAYVNSNNFLSNLTEGSKDYYKSVLTEMGVENASEVVKNALAKQTYALRLEKLLDANASKAEITALQNEAEQYGISSSEMTNYVLQKKIANDNALDTSKSIKNLISLATQCGATGKVVEALKNLLIETSKLEDIENDSLSNYTASIKTDAQHAVDEAIHAKSEAHGKQAHKISKLNKKLQKLLKDGRKKISVDVTPSTKSSGSGKDKGSSSNSKQQIDWISRSLDRLSSKLDLVKSKYDNLVNSKKIKTSDDLLNARNKNLDEQYNILKKTEQYQSKAEKKYTKKANTVKLSGSLKKAVREGRISGSMKKLIASYGEKTANKIQKYQDYYDKAQNAKKEKQSTIVAKRELKKEQYQNYVDLYDSRTTRAEAKEAVQTNYTDKNNSINTQLENIKKSYKYQKLIADLTGDKAEADKLEYDMQKKIAELKLQQIQNIQKDYDNRIGLIDNDIQDIDNAVALAEARGKIVTANYYKSQNDLQRNKRQEAVVERDKVRTELASAMKDGSIKMYSDEWYEVQSTLQSLDNTINDCDVEIAENTTAIREVHDAMLEELAEYANRMNTEADFLSTLLSREELTDSEKGTFTNAGLGTLGAYGINMETAQSQIRELNREFAILQEMKKKGILDYGDGNHIYNSVEQLEDAYDKLIDKQQEWTKNEFDAEQKIIDLMKEYYQAQVDYMKEIIDAKKEALDMEKD